MLENKNCFQAGDDLAPNRMSWIAEQNIRIMYLNLKLHLWKTGLRQNRLAQMVGIDEATLSKIVNGFREPSVDVRRRIGIALNRDENWLFREAGALRQRRPGKEKKRLAGAPESGAAS